MPGQAGRSWLWAINLPPSYAESIVQALLERCFKHDRSYYPYFFALRCRLRKAGREFRRGRRWLRKRVVVLMRYRRMILPKSLPASQRSHGRIGCARTPDERDVDGRVVN